MFSIQSENGHWVVDSLPLDRVYGDATTGDPLGARRFGTRRGATLVASRMMRLGYDRLIVVDAPASPKPAQEVIEMFID
jgi:hypothetical protein